MNLPENTPIALFVYNRPLHTKRTVEALLYNAEAAGSDLYVFSDAAANLAEAGAVTQVREYIRTIKGFSSTIIVERDVNLGLAGSIITGVSQVLAIAGTVIVVEDDMIVSPYFLRFMNDGLRKYANDERVASIHGYVYPVTTPLPETFFLRGAGCWGWATWMRAWQHFQPDGQALANELKRRGLVKGFDLDGAYPYYRMLLDQISGRNNSWAIRWRASTYLANMLTLYPGRNLLENIGLDGTGTHCKSSFDLGQTISDQPIFVADIEVEEDSRSRAAVASSLRRWRRSLWKHRMQQLFQIMRERLVLK
jgi:hypothetical protein